MALRINAFPYDGMTEKGGSGVLDEGIDSSTRTCQSSADGVGLSATSGSPRSPAATRPEVYRPLPGLKLDLDSR